jgi:hypothetical protein
MIKVNKACSFDSKPERLDLDVGSLNACLLYMFACVFSIRVNFLEHLEHWKRDVMRAAAQTVTEKVRPFLNCCLNL